MNNGFLKSNWSAISVYITCFILLSILPVLQNLDRGIIHFLLSFFPSLMDQKIYRPDWALYCEVLAFALVSIFLIANAITNDKKDYPFFFFSLLLGLIGCEIYFLSEYGILIKFILPVILLISGYLFQILVDRTQQNTLRQLYDTHEKNYVMGLAFLRQGHLEWAFEKLKSCPPKAHVMDVLYRIAQDFEKRKQFGKASTVYDHLINQDANFRDVVHKKKQIQQKILAHGKEMPSDNEKAGKTETTLPDLIKNPVLGNYRLENEIGKGATGTVYLARDTRSGQKVAIKILPLAKDFEDSDIENVKRRFFREAETAGQLNYPNIVKIHDADEINGLAYIAMELLTGHDLTRYTHKDNLLSPVMAMGIVYKAAKAMDYAHSRQVIHRDLKPANIMFDPKRKQIKITDFGIARLIDASRTRTGIILGTPAYMSPEQLEGNQIDGRSDLFSLGVLLFHLLTGELPFKGESLAMLMYLIANEPHRDIFQLRPDLAQLFPDLAAIIDKALEKEPGDRFQSGKEMALALKTCVRKVESSVYS